MTDFAIEVILTRVTFVIWMAMIEGTVMEMPRKNCEEVVEVMEEWNIGINEDENFQRTTTNAPTNTTAPDRPLVTTPATEREPPMSFWLTLLSSHVLNSRTNIFRSSKHRARGRYT